MRCPNCATDNIPGVDACESCGTDLAGLDLPEAARGFRGRLMTDRVADLPLSPPVSIESTHTVEQAVRTMREAGVGCVWVRDNGKLCGIFNERHLLTRVLRRDLDPAATPVSEVMSPDPLKLRPDDPPAFAVHCMVDRNFRHLPVVSGGELLGTVSVRSILRYLKTELLG